MIEFVAPNKSVWFPGVFTPGAQPYTIVPGYDIIETRTDGDDRESNLLASVQAGFAVDAHGKKYLIVWGGIRNAIMGDDDGS